MGYISSAFENYKNQVISPDAPQIQVEETERAFYAAFAQMITFLKYIATIPDQAGIDMLNAIDEETEAFATAFCEKHNISYKKE